jgi:uncharacterized phage protein (TIGR01671 family)
MKKLNKLREIKFRVFDKVNKKMIYPNDFFYEPLMLTLNGLIYKNGKLLDYILMQYTGYKDNNNKEIYEFDIVHVLDHYQGDIFINKFNGRIIFLEDIWWIKNSGSLGMSLNEYCNNFCGGIIGNFYENKELLYKSKNKIRS